MLLNRSYIFLVILLSVIQVGSCYFMGRSPPFFDQASSGYNSMGYNYPRYGSLNTPLTQYPPYNQYSLFQSQYSPYSSGIFGQPGETYPMGAGAMGAGFGGYPATMGGGYPPMMGGSYPPMMGSGYPNAMMGGGLQNQLGKK